MPESDPITRVLDEVRAAFIEDRRGDVATYIPQLSATPPDLFGISLASLEGRVYSAGDSAYSFSIQSVSKPFVHALALADHRLEGVLARVGAEPSGEAFNAISLEPGTGRPANPMINAGALVTTALVKAANPDERFERIRAMLGAFAGRELALDEAVYRSEMETADRNRALGYLMRSAGSLDADVEETLDVYVRQCALLVTTRDLAVMAATLANGGVNPVTGEAVISAQAASHVLTVMGTCGMYDYSGEWLLRVGLPAKSGVAGAVMAAKPAQFGFGLFSPRLDARGNSVRAVEACQELAERFGLHLLNHPGQATASTYLTVTGLERRSGASRSPEEMRAIDRRGASIRIRGLQGELGFAAAEQILRSLHPAMQAEPAPGGWLILELDRVARIHPTAVAMFQALAADLAGAGVTCVIADSAGRDLIPGIPEFASADDALRWCEDDLLAREPAA
jgi:glutaminase